MASDLSPELQLEWRLIALRLPSIVIVLLALPLIGLPDGLLLIARAILGFAVVYVLALRQLVLRAPQVVANGFLPGAVDSLLTFGIVLLTGGLSSPMYPISYLVAVASALRYGYAPSLLMPAAFFALGAFGHLSTGTPLEADTIYKPALLALAVAVAGCLTEQKRQSEDALQQRLQAARLVNNATASLSATLDPAEVAQGIADALTSLFGRTALVLKLGRQPEYGGAAGALVTRGLEDLDVATKEALVRLCEQSLAEPASGPRQRRIAIPWRDRSITYLGLGAAGAPLAGLSFVHPRQALIRDEAVDSFLEEATLALDNALLYQRFSARSLDLERAYADLGSAHQELLQMDDMKTNFLANVSHEFRTPLTSIRSFSEMLLSYESEEEVQREFVSIINAESERLTRMINDVLDITKIESGEMDWRMELVDLGELLEEAAKTHGPLIRQHGLSFVAEVQPPLPPLTGDRDRLRQVLGNLLGNALKFTREGSITLATQVREGEVEISVADTGPGIAPDDQQRIFEKFQQVGSVLTDKPEGTGLGLSICREVVEHHGGRIWVESTPGKGSTFHAVLPAA